MVTPLTLIDANSTPEVVLEQGLRRWYGRPVRIAALRWTAMDSFSTNPISRLEVTLDSGEHLPVIFKRCLHKPAKDIAQEVRLYQGVLADSGLDAPALYAAVCDDGTGRYWLFLEDVGDWRLEYCETDVWLTAFRWLAGLHAAFYDRDPALRSLGYLQEHDPDFYRSVARLARQTLARRGTPEALARFERLMRGGLERATAELGGVPRTLVHGDFSCHNIMVQPGGRIRTIDWEWAAIGVPAWDVVRLLDGWGEERRRFLAVYLDAVSHQTPTAFDHKAFERSLGHCRVMMKLWRIRWWAKACQEPGGVNRLLDGIESLWGDRESGIANA